jgi:phosphohistidine phosphatase
MPHQLLAKGLSLDLFLVRHADALSLGDQGIMEDAERPLSEGGQKQARALASALLRKGIFLNRIVTSPLLRARQTGEGLAVPEEVPAPILSQCDELGPGTRPKRVARALRAFDEPFIAAVGHQPDLGKLAAWLIGGRKARIDLAKAGVAWIEFPEKPRKGSGRLVLLLPPEWYEDHGHSSPPAVPTNTESKDVLI